MDRTIRQKHIAEQANKALFSLLRKKVIQIFKLTYSINSKANGTLWVQNMRVWKYRYNRDNQIEVLIEHIPFQKEHTLIYNVW